MALVVYIGALQAAHCRLVQPATERDEGGFTPISQLLETGEDPPLKIPTYSLGSNSLTRTWRAALLILKPFRGETAITKASIGNGSGVSKVFLDAEIYACDIYILCVVPFLSWISGPFEATFMDYEIPKTISAFSPMGVWWFILKGGRKKKLLLIKIATIGNYNSWFTRDVMDAMLLSR